MFVARFSKFILKSTVYFSAGLIGGALFLLVAISWFFVELLSPSNENYALAHKIQTVTTPLRGNVEQLLQIGQNYILELTVYDQLNQKNTFAKAADLCEVICNESFFDEKQHIEQRGTYLNQFSATWGAQALKDPQFLLTLAETETLAHLYSPQLRQTIADFAHFSAASSTSSLEKIKLGLQIPKAGFLELRQWAEKEQTLKNWERLRKLKSLRKTCSTQSLKSIRSECQVLTK